MMKRKRYGASVREIKAYMLGLYMLGLIHVWLMRDGTEV